MAQAIVGRLIGQRSVQCRDFSHALKMAVARNRLEGLDDWSCPAWRVVAKTQRDGSTTYYVKPNSAARTNIARGIRVVC